MIARAPTVVFHNSILEFGWPGVKFSAPPWKQQIAKPCMRSLSNLFKRRGITGRRRCARERVAENGSARARVQIFIDAQNGGSLRDEDTTRNVIYATRTMIPIVVPRRAPRAYRSCTSRVASTTPTRRVGRQLELDAGPGCIPGRSSVASSPGGSRRSRDRDRSENSSLRNLSIAPIGEQNPPRRTDTLTAVVGRRQRTSRSSRQHAGSSRLNRRDFQRAPPVRAHRRSRRQSIKTTFRMSTHRRLEDGSIARKTLPRPSRADFLSPCTNTSARFDHFSRTDPRSSSLRVIHTTRSHRHPVILSLSGRIRPRRCPVEPQGSNRRRPRDTCRARWPRRRASAPRAAPYAPTARHPRRRVPRVGTISSFGAFHLLGRRARRLVAIDEVDVLDGHVLATVERVECGERRHPVRVHQAGEDGSPWQDHFSRALEATSTRGDPRDAADAFIQLAAWRTD